MAYVFVQKDKRKKLESHMQKCIFVGYPPDYHAWTFYNPVTGQFIISKCAAFDERGLLHLLLFLSLLHNLLCPLHLQLFSGDPSAR